MKWTCPVVGLVWIPNDGKWTTMTLWRGKSPVHCMERIGKLNRTSNKTKKIQENIAFNEYSCSETLGVYAPAMRVLGTVQMVLTVKCPANLCRGRSCDWCVWILRLRLMLGDSLTRNFKLGIGKFCAITGMNDCCYWKCSSWLKMRVPLWNAGCKNARVHASSERFESGGNFVESMEVKRRSRWVVSGIC